ncbi:MAG TPA: nucleotide disphospho-sugar-binding domain-containing protein [Trebonia sp.]|nr:nucleotide disphospho-sugar-binding domain-containing protein [Trebonia sp.]
MSRFLIVTLPLDGHAYRAAAVADALAARGHEVAWCGSTAYLRTLLAPDAVVFPTGTRLFREQAGHGIGALKSLWQQYVIPMARFTLPTVDQAVRAYRPDVVLVDQHAVAGAVAARRHRLPWATLITQAMELTHPLAALPRVDAWIAAQLASFCRDVAGDVAGDIAREAGDGSDGQLHVRLLFSPDLVIAFTTAAVIGEQPFPDHFALVGAAMRDRRGSFAMDQLDPGRRKVLISVGTLATGLAGDFYQRAVAAVAPLGATLQAIIIGPPELVPDRPGNVLVVPSVPMLALLPRLDAVISHGGMNTVSETLAHGLPLVIAPIRHDQPVVAAQVARAGAAIRVPFSRVRPAQLREALVTILDDPSYRQAAERIRDSFAAAGGALAAADRLERLAQIAR